MKGIIIEFYQVRGYGYLNIDKGVEFCFYSKDIQNNNRSFKKGDEVEFDFYRGHGVRAVNVRNVEQPVKNIDTSQEESLYGHTV